MPPAHQTVPSASGAITIRGLAPELKSRLRVRAAHNARSMEAEARAILEAALAAPNEDAVDLATFARTLFGPLGGAELELPSRELVGDPPGLEPGDVKPALAESGSGSARARANRTAERRRR